MSQAVSAVENFFTALETKSLEDCAARLGELVTDDFVWENIGLPTCNGREAAQQFLVGFAQAIPLAGLKVETLAIAAQGNKVITERIDHFIDATGAVLASVPLAGVLEVAADGRISAWRDYFDPRPFVGG
jgi:limonene-1,2-epoxide hydrolase